MEAILINLVGAKLNISKLNHPHELLWNFIFLIKEWVFIIFYVKV